MDSLMSKQFSAILTTLGTQRLAAAALANIPLGITQMAVGDGGGILPTPTPEQTGLINERFRAPLNRLVIADQAANVIRAEMIMPPQIGGFWLREVGLFNNQGECLAVANLPESYKPLLAEGAGRFQVITIWLAVSSTANVQLIADPAVMLATAEEVSKAKNQAMDYTDEMAVEIDKATKNAIAAAVKSAIRDAWELDNPVGDVRFFNQNVNPNEKWPWSTWEYLGEDRTLRLAKADGSDLGAIGGSDAITLNRDNLPNVQIDVTGTAAETDLGTKTTQGAGKHVHNGGWGAPGDKWGEKYSGTDNQGPHDMTQTSEAPDHVHELELGPHGHSVSGKTAALGDGNRIDVTNKYIKLMAWYRTA